MDPDVVLLYILTDDGVPAALLNPNKFERVVAYPFEFADPIVAPGVPGPVM
jgi:hypothetical protein